jgi:hypothetical protein
MTTADFINEALGFAIGKIVVVSGRDGEAVFQFLSLQVKPAIEGTGKAAFVYDSRSNMFFQGRDFRKDVNEARIWEFMSLMAEGSAVLLVSNEFDPADPKQNRTPASLEVDVMLDIFKSSQVDGLMMGYSRRYGITRELFPFISKVYFYDIPMANITFIKDQVPERP